MHSLGRVAQIYWDESDRRWILISELQRCFTVICGALVRSVIVETSQQPGAKKRQSNIRFSSRMHFLRIRRMNATHAWRWTLVGAEDSEQHSQSFTGVWPKTSALHSSFLYFLLLNCNSVEWNKKISVKDGLPALPPPRPPHPNFVHTCKTHWFLHLCCTLDINAVSC